MITNKSILREYLAADLARYSRRSPAFLGYFYGDETLATQVFLKRLRRTEYYYNTMGGENRNVLKMIRFAFSFFLYRRMQLKYRILIPLNVVGPGLYIPHRFGGVIINAKSVGKNCTISSGCVLGNKRDADDRPILGDNVEVCIGAKIIGNVRIGNDVIIAPNSVVVKNVLDKDVVSGIPAKSIKR